MNMPKKRRELTAVHAALIALLLVSIAYWAAAPGKQAAPEAFTRLYFSAKPRGTAGIGEQYVSRFVLENKELKKREYTYSIQLDDATILEHDLNLEGGEKLEAEFAVVFDSAGVHKVQVNALKKGAYVDKDYNIWKNVAVGDRES